MLEETNLPRQNPPIAKRAKTPGSGRVAGVPNKISGALRDMILQATERAGGEDGAVGYLAEQAKKNPQAFLALLGKTLPLSSELSVAASQAIVVLTGVPHNPEFDRDVDGSPD
jgi:hypothetical protein